MASVFEKLVDACKDVQQVLGDLESQKDNLFNDVNSLKAQKAVFVGDISDLIRSRDNAAAEVNIAKRDAIAEIESKKKEVADLRARVEAERAALTTREAQLTASLEEIGKIKDEYGVKFADLADRERALSSKLSRLADLGIALTQ